MVEAGVVHPIAVHVDVLPARQVFDIDALCPSDHVEDGGGAALMEKIPRILLEPAPRLAGQVPLPVPLPRRRGVDIPLFRFRPSALPSEPLFCHADPPLDSSSRTPKKAVQTQAGCPTHTTFY